MYIDLVIYISLFLDDKSWGDCRTLSKLIHSETSKHVKERKGRKCQKLANNWQLLRNVTSAPNLLFSDYYFDGYIFAEEIFILKVMLSH